MVYMNTFAKILVAVLGLAVAIYYFTLNRQINQAPIGVTWTTYRNNQYGFTIKYPSVYSIEELREPISTKYSSFKFLSVVDPKDTSPAASVWHNLDLEEDRATTT
jgi:hypothetical protein